MAPKLVIWGASDQATVVAEIIRLQGEYELVGFLDDVNPERHGTKHCGLPVLGGREQLDALLQQGVGHLILGFGHCRARVEIGELVREKGFALASAVHPQAVVAPGGTVAAGTVIKPGAVIDHDVTIDENVIVGAAAYVAHGARLGSCVLLSGGTRIGSRAAIGRATWVGLSATVKNRVSVGARCVVGAGSVVLADLPDGIVAYGVPARVVRDSTPEDFEIARPAGARA